MNNRVTIGLLLILVILGLYLYFFELNEPNQDLFDENAILIPGFGSYDEFDIVGLEIDGPQGSVQFARTSDTLSQPWEMLQPEALPSDAVDQVRVNGTAVRLGRLTANQVISSTDLVQYGLSPPELTVTLTISNGDKVVFYTGNQTPVNYSYYMQPETDSESIYVVFSVAVTELHRLLAEIPLVPTP
ncbi:MAG: DUF4340 domain-containing protein, partial [Chloroflexota bacterium]